MIRLLLILLAIILLASCSSPKYTYHFDHYDYNSGRKNTSMHTALPNNAGNVDKNPLTLNNKSLTASTDNGIIALPEKEIETPDDKMMGAEKINSPTAAELARSYKEVSKAQRNEFRKAMREHMRRYIIPSKKSK